MSLDKAFQIFLEEAAELLQNMENCLLNPQHIEDHDELVNSLFRAAHTIKGSAAIFAIEAIVNFTHVVESVLDRVRSDELPLDEKLVNLLLLCKDHIQLQIDSIHEDQVILDASALDVEQELIGKLNAFLPGDRAVAVADSTENNAAEPVESDNVGNDNWHISIRFDADCIRCGMDPISHVRHLQKLGEIVHIETLFDNLPELEELDPEATCTGFEINFRSDASKAEIEEVFEFVMDGSEINILPPNARALDFIEAIQALDDKDMRLGEMLVQCGTLTEHELSRLLEIQEQMVLEHDEKRPIGELIVEQHLATPEVVDAALKQQSENKVAKDKQARFVRVDADKLDTLINLIGELVTSSACINAEVKETGNSRLIESTLPLSRLVEEVRDCTLNLRMVQIGETFNRFHRVVRDVAVGLGKDIRLVIEGADTELDKTVIEKIGDPLTHLVRNAIDHGVEDKESRVAAGKSAQGTVTLNAYHESGSIVIEVSDDGRGLDREKLLAKAIEKGLVNEHAMLSDQEVYQLIFEPGFSTAGQISDISGRGVGMDVVRRNIEALRGTIDIVSLLGQGTTMRIRLPLTLAIIDGFLVKVGTNTYVIPLDMVVECIELSETDKARYEDQNYIRLRGEALPYVRLRDLFVNDGQPGKRESIVVVQYGDKRAGFAVDMLLGEFQTVIKPLSKIFESLSGIAGSTIMGSGEVALILDVPSLIQRIEQREQTFLLDGTESKRQSEKQDSQQALNGR